MAGQPFDYSNIPVGFYDSVLRDGNPVRRLWHVSRDGCCSGKMNAFPR
jgi:hypothetical protein